MANKPKIQHKKPFVWYGGSEYLDVNTERGMRTLMRYLKYPERAFRYFRVTDKEGKTLDKIKKGVNYDIHLINIVGMHFVWKASPANPYSDERVIQALHIIGIPQELIDRMDLSKLIIHDRPKYNAGEMGILMKAGHTYYLVNKD